MRFVDFDLVDQDETVPRRHERWEPE